MKQKRINFKLFGWRIFFDFDREETCHAKRQSRSNLSRRMKELRNHRYHEKKGCCEMCGQHFEKSELQMHHVLPHKAFPQWARKHWNVMMLCRRCHWQIHFNTMLNIQAMKRTATARGIDLSREFYYATARRWQENQTMKGGEL